MEPYRNLKQTVCNRPLEFNEALVHALKNIFNFHGRARRSEYWWTYLAMYILTILIVYISMFATLGFTSLGDKESMESLAPGALITFLVIVGVWTIIYVLVMLSVEIRRLHDTGRSGWWIGASLLLALAAIVVLCIAIATNSIALYVLMGLLFLAEIVIGLYIFVVTLLDSNPNENKYGISQKYQVETAEEEIAEEPTDTEEISKEPQTIVEETVIESNVDDE